ncbi:hypothetical protein A7P82_03930 [Staphylococcus epidermidis]|nr:hypothetical protein A7P82_03930 [Staphylococcus epidermidis]
MLRCYFNVFSFYQNGKLYLLKITKPVTWLWLDRHLQLNISNVKVTMIKQTPKLHLLILSREVDKKEYSLLQIPTK